MQIIPDPSFALLMTLPFLVTMVALNVLLVRPFREYLESREQATDGARDEATSLEAEAADKLGTLEARLADARSRAADAREAVRQEGLDYEAATLRKARGAAEARLEEALQGIAAEREAAGRSLRDSASVLSTDIAARVLGRSVGTLDA